MEDYENYFENFTLQNKSNNLDDDLKKTVASINRIDSQRYLLTKRVNEVDGLLISLKNENFLISFSQRQSLPPTISRDLESLEQYYHELEKIKLSHSEITFAYRQKQKDVDVLKQKTIGQLTELRDAAIKNLEDANNRKRTLEAEFANIPDKSTQFSKNLTVL